MYYGGERNVPGAPGNLMAGTPHGKMYEQQPREYLNQRMPVYPPGFGPQPQQAQPQLPQPGTPVQLELPLAMRGLQGPAPMGNAGALAAGNTLIDPRFQIPGGQSPYRQPVLPTEKSPEENIPFLLPGSYSPKANIPAGFQNKFVS